MRSLADIRAQGRSFQVVSALAVLALALFALALQQYDLRGFIDRASMAGLLACAAGLLAMTVGAPRLAAALAIAAFAGGLAGLAHYEGTAPAAAAGADGAGPFGVLSQAVAGATMVAGVAIGAAMILRKPRHRAMVVVSMGAVIVAVGAAGLVHDAFPGMDAGAPDLWVALWRALVLVVLGIAVIALGSPRRRRNRMVRWLFLPAGLAVIAASLLLAELIRVQEIDQTEKAIGNVMVRVEDQLAARLRGSLLGIDRMARSWTWRGRPERNAWKTDAWLFVDHLPELQAVAWVDADTRVRWLAPLAGSHALQNRVLGEEQRRRSALERARAERGLTMSAPLDLAIGGRGFIAAAPITPGAEFGGYIAGFFRFEPLFEAVLENIAEGYVVTILDAGSPVYSSAGPGATTAERWHRSTAFGMRGAELTIRIEPLDAALDRHLTWLPMVTLAIGCFVAVLVALAVYQAEVARLQARRLGYAVQRRDRVEAELRRYQRELEDRVEARTADLNAKQEELERSNAELERLATTDPLTGVCNRRRFIDLAEHEFKAARRYDRDLALVMFDLDRFKEVNDTAGHQCGDAVLAAAAECTGAVLRETDCLARYGGEEFVVLLAESGRDAVLSAAERMRRAMEQLEVDCDGRSFRCTASFGVTGLRPDDADIDALLERSDRALYQAKAAGRNRVEFLDG